MTGADLLNLGNPKVILNSLREYGASDRKIRLFACACCRHIWPLLEDERSRRAVEFAERFADGHASREELADAEWAVKPVAWCAQIAFGSESQEWRVAKAAEITVRQVVLPPILLLDGFIERAEVSSLLGDIFDTLFRPVVLHPSCLTPTVVSLAQHIYDHRSFDRLPELAQALQDAGCTDPEIMGHLRGPGPHWRGCHILDLLLGKS